MKNKKILASVVTIMLLATGTFAWQSFNQLATNEIVERVDTPGARLHDYFNGSDKNVFVENYASGNYAPDVYARIRLLEYFEYGKDAGSQDANPIAITVVRGDIQQEGTPSISNPETWDIYTLGSEADEDVESIRTFRDLELGGSTVYMPTFNQDNTDLTAEIKGTYRDENGDVKVDPYDDYKSYEVDDTDEGAVVTEAGEAATKTIHKAKETQEATIMSMEQWMLLDEEDQIGDYWVFDTTGWAYYARPIVGHTATGLLLDGISMESNPSDEWYYALEVTAQMATFGDWGDEPTDQSSGDGSGMYEDMTAESKEFLEIVSGADGTVKPEGQAEVTKLEFVSASEEELTEEDLAIKVGESTKFIANAEVVYSQELDSESVVKWSIAEVEDTTMSTFIDTRSSRLSEGELSGTLVEGTFTPVAAMAGYEYDITATSVLTPRISKTMRVFVYDDSLALVITKSGSLTDVKAEASHELTANYVISGSKAPVKWTVEETTGSSGLDEDKLNKLISENGVFVPTKSMIGGSYTITATTTIVPVISQSIELSVYTIGTDQDDLEGDGIASLALSVAGDVSALNLHLNQYTLQMDVVVKGLKDSNYKWSIEEIGTSIGANISNVINTSTGLLTVTDDMEGGTYRVTSTSIVDDDIQDYKDIIVRNGEVIVDTPGSVSSITLSPTLYELEMSAEIVGFTNQNVTWSIEEEGTSINADLTGVIDKDTGKLTMKDAMAGGKYRITATSTEDDDISGYKDITLTSPTVTVETAGKVSSITLSPTLYELGMSATVVGLIDQDVTWDIEEEDTSINADLTGVINEATGKLTMKDAMAGGKYRVTATVGSKSGYTYISVTTPTVTVETAGKVSSITLSSTLYELVMNKTVVGLIDQDVTWDIEEEGTSINADLTGVINEATGKLTMKDAMAGGKYRVTATVGSESGYTYISVTAPTFEIVVDDDLEYVQAGTSFTFKTNITGLRSTATTWSRSGNSNSSTTIAASTGVLTVAAAETVGGSIKISAVSDSYSGLDDTVTIKIDSSNTHITSAEGSNTTVKIGGVDFYVLDVGNKDTYATATGGTKTMRSAALLLAKEPWNNQDYVFNTSRSDSYNNSAWGGSNLQATLESEITNNTALLSHALRVNTTVSASSNTYDLFFPLSLAEFGTYALEGTTRAKDSGGSISGDASRWSRTRQSASYVRIIDGSAGTTNGVYKTASHTRAVRPAFFYDLGTASTASSSITVSSAGDVSKMTLSSSNYTLQMSTDVKTLIDTVDWTVTESSGSSNMTQAELNATMSDTGLFTAIDAMAGGSYIIKATSTIDSSVSGSKIISISQPEVTIDAGKSRLDRGTSATYTATVTGLRSTSVSWSMSGNTSSSTTQSSGKLTAASAETVGNVIKITATSNSVNSISGTANIVITMPYTGATTAELKSIIGTEKIVTLDGVAFYILAQDDVYKGTAAGAYSSYVSGLLLWSVDAWNDKNYTFSSAGKSDWVTSDLRSSLQSEVSSYSTINSVSIYAGTSIYSYAADATVETYDKLFPLSYDEFNNYNLSGDNRAKMDSTGVSSYYWLRQGSSSSVTRNIVASTGKVHSTGSSSSSRAVRVALWIELASEASQ